VTTQSDTDFCSKSNRSINVADIEIMKAYTHAMQNLPSPSNGFVTDGTLTVASNDGYVIGEIWWNCVSEGWVVDFKRYGEDR
jgi:hypothetical protein